MTKFVATVHVSYLFLVAQLRFINFLTIYSLLFLCVKVQTLGFHMLMHHLPYLRAASVTHLLGSMRQVVLSDIVHIGYMLSVPPAQLNGCHICQYII